MHLDTDELEVINATDTIPSISLIIGVTPQIALRPEAKKAVKFAADKARKYLQGVYPEKMFKPVIHNLEQAIASVDYELVSKSLAIYASPVLSKVFYLDIPVEDRIVVNASFEIRDLIYAKQPSLNYLALLINGRDARFYLGDNDMLVALGAEIPQQLSENDVAERVTNFSDPSERKEVLLDKFLKRVDNELSGLLNVHLLPVFLVGVDRVTGHFRKVSVNNEHIADVIAGNYQAMTLQEIKELLQPRVDAWSDNNGKTLRDVIERAQNARKLVTGIREVWRAAMEKRGHLLIVEKDYVYPTKDNSSVFTRDAVDEAIHEVIKAGGEVRFVNKNYLENYGRIILLRHF